MDTPALRCAAAMCVCVSGRKALALYAHGGIGAQLQRVRGERGRERDIKSVCENTDYGTEKTSACQ